MKKEKVYSEVIETTEGVHALIARAIVHSASKHNVQILLEYEDKIVDAKSILGVMSLGIPSGKNIRIFGAGDKAEKAIKEVMQVIK